MTREEAISVLKLIHTEENGIVREPLNMAIKALEQDTILDKIRAEIEQKRIGYPPSAEYYWAIKECLQIIDKYKAESEE